MRGRVEGFDNTMADVRDVWQHYLQEEIPDLQTEINQILASGDLVAYFATNTATSALDYRLLTPAVFIESTPSGLNPVGSLSTTDNV